MYFLAKFWKWCFLNVSDVIYGWIFLIRIFHHFWYLNVFFEFDLRVIHFNKASLLTTQLLSHLLVLQWLLLAVESIFVYDVHWTEKNALFERKRHWEKRGETEISSSFIAFHVQTGCFPNTFSEYSGCIHWLISLISFNNRIFSLRWRKIAANARC